MQDAPADDPFSQLSLSRGPSGETLHLERYHKCGRDPFFVSTAFYCITKCYVMRVQGFDLQGRCPFPFIVKHLCSGVKTIASTADHCRLGSQTLHVVQDFQTLAVLKSVTAA